MVLTNLIIKMCKEQKLKPTIKRVGNIATACRIADIPTIIKGSQINIAKEVVSDLLSTAVMAATPAHKYDVCPICNTQMEDVLLINNIKAKYCAKHRVALPIKK